MAYNVYTIQFVFVVDPDVCIVGAQDVMRYILIMTDGITYTGHTTHNSIFVRDESSVHYESRSRRNRTQPPPKQTKQANALVRSLCGRRT